MKRLSRKQVYDRLGNLVSTADYTYDSNGGDNNYTVHKGQFFQVTDSEGWEKNGYDSRGRLQRTTRYLSKYDKTYTTTYDYNSADKVTSIVYPNSAPTLTISYSYHAGGSLNQVKRCRFLVLTTRGRTSR